MAQSTSPSPIIDYFVRELSGSLPDDERSKLNGYSHAIAQTTHHGDFRRAWHCADWALELDRKTPESQEHKVRERLHEEHKLWKDTIFGAEFGMMIGDHVGPGQDAEIQWVDDAVAMAKSVAASSNWSAVPWEELLKGMLAIAPPAD